ncbi:MAG: FkbM family methyltransferase, partial [Ginsengibacter sp.]
KLSLIKIDAEGLDYYILKTLLPILEEFHPTIIMEVFENLSDQLRGEMFEFLKKLNYDILNIGDFETNINFKPIPVKNKNDMPHRGLTENILIVIPGRYPN